VRARFHDRLYTRLIVVKNILAFTLTGGGAFWFHSAEMTLLGSILSLSGSVITARASLSDPGADPSRARRGIARGLLRYGLPIVGANLLYLTMPLANRSLAAVLYGFSESGQFSLAYDMGAKAVQAIGSTLDVILFQIAVAAHERHGAEHSKRQLADNIAIVVAIVLPSCTGIWLILPSVEQIIVPSQYRGPFGHLLTLMMAGLFAFAMILYGINPIFQIAKRTAPMIGAAVVACLVDAILLMVLPRGDDASALAIAQTGGFIGAFVTLTLVAALTRPQWPRWRDIGGAVVGTAAMAAILLPLRESTPGLVTLVLQIMSGVVIYTFFVVALDIAGLRTLFLARLRPLAARFRIS
jgi:O-antigen/teichoic acid export membrane protein